MCVVWRVVGMASPVSSRVAALATPATSPERCTARASKPKLLDAELDWQGVPAGSARPTESGWDGVDGGQCPRYGAWVVREYRRAVPALRGVGWREASVGGVRVAMCGLCRTITNGWGHACVQYR